MGPESGMHAPRHSQQQPALACWLTTAKEFDVCCLWYLLHNQHCKNGCLPAAALAAPCRRPTFLPAMKLKPLRPEAVLADPRKQVLAGYLAALADLAHPKQALRILGDTPRLQVGGRMGGQGAGQCWRRCNACECPSPGEPYLAASKS